MKVKKTMMSKRHHRFCSKCGAELPDNIRGRLQKLLGKDCNGILGLDNHTAHRILELKEGEEQDVVK